ncbi:hypothetical protein ACTXT7_001572 [Hymenolepis weldensis]
MLNSELVLTHYDSNLPMDLAGDASPYEIDAVTYHTFLDGPEKVPENGGYCQADGPSRPIYSQCEQNEETVITFVSIERDVQYTLAESNRNTPVTAEDIRKETEKDAILQQALKFIQFKWSSFRPKGDMRELYSRRDLVFLDQVIVSALGK